MPVKSPAVVPSALAVIVISPSAVLIEFPTDQEIDLPAKSSKLSPELVKLMLPLTMIAPCDFD